MPTRGYISKNIIYKDLRKMLLSSNYIGMDDLNAYELPIFLDVHKLPFSEDHLKEFFKSPIDEIGVRHVNYFYDKGAYMCFCLLDAPDSLAVENHHDKAGIKKCEWIIEVEVAKL